MPSRYHYHLACPLPAPRAAHLTQFLDAQPAETRPLFLTLEILAETSLPHPFLRQRCAAALAADLPPAIEYHFRAITGPAAAPRLTATGPMTDHDRFLAHLRTALSAQSITAPHHLPRPTIFLNMVQNLDAPRPYLFSWAPTHVALIEEDKITGLHRTLHTATLPPPIAPRFDFADSHAA